MTFADLRSATPELATAIQIYQPEYANLHRAAEQTIQQLASDQRAFVAAAHEQALCDMGFHTRTTTVRGEHRIRAVSEDAIVAVNVESSGRIDIDMARCAGNACVPIMQELRRRVAAYGVATDPRRTRKTRVGIDGGPILSGEVVPGAEASARKRQGQRAPRVQQEGR
jgi:hypothetical protein